MSRSRRRMFRPMSVMTSMSGGIDWMSAPCGEMKFPRIAAELVGVRVAAAG